MKTLSILNVLIFSCILGCLGGMPTETQTPVEEASPSNNGTSNALAILELTSSKQSYALGETIPLDLKIQNGKFDLLVPFSVVASPNVFKQLSVTDSNGQVLRMAKPVAPSIPLKTLYKGGKSMRCIKGYDFKATQNQTISLDNLSAHFQLKPGTYSIKVTTVMEVYKESIQDQHPQIIELEREIMNFQNNTSQQFTPEAKKEAISYTQDQIDFIKEKYKDQFQDIYLPIKSLRGKTSLESNTITISIE
ncbi:hypothetical protein C6497_08290 [Candidatus Poribacteria bacterium]|nr:MAG: hypothetical protein C6497_08290 [Candidatus Poribacteria bacterium]